MYITLTLLLGSCFLYLAAPVDDQAWKDYKLEYGKVYSKGEDAARYKTWKKKAAEIELHNADYTNTYTQELNEFADMTEKEFIEQYCGCLRIPEEVLNGSLTSDGEKFVSSPSNVLPNEFDWVSKGYVTPVKNQGRCGSCYTFSVTGSLEGAWFKKTNRLISLSEQQILDCSGRFGNHGCHGGYFVNTWNYLRRAGGIQTEESYPYKGYVRSCTFNRGKVVAKIRTYRYVERGNENRLKEALATVGPISVAIDAGRPGFRSYRTGVYYEQPCSTYRSTHTVLVVGYGSENGQDYWLVKNSWGRRWGLNGYIKMARNRGNACGIATYPNYPIV